VGGVSGRAGARAGGSNPFANHSFACRDGRRHPGFPDGSALRGASSERRPRSVRHPSWVSSRGGIAPVTADVRRPPRRGTSSRMRHKAHAPDAGTIRRRMRSREDASFARSFDPYTSILTTHGGIKSVVRGGAVVSASRLGKPSQEGGTNTGAGRTDVGRLAAHHRSRKGGSVLRREKEGGHGLRPCEDQGSPGSIARTSCFSCRESVGDYWPRIRSANALQKERTGSSERGPSSG
jgi:hypothetical protein